MAEAVEQKAGIVENSKTGRFEESWPDLHRGHGKCHTRRSRDHTIANQGGGTVWWGGEAVDDHRPRATEPTTIGQSRLTPTSGEGVSHPGGQTE